MKQFVVLYRSEYRDAIMTDNDIPFGFECWADDIEHAEEQCVDSEPDGVIVYVFEGDSYNAALDEYYQSMYRVI